MCKQLLSYQRSNQSQSVIVISSDCFAALHADWIEHALEMEGESYLKTPEEDLSWLVLNNVDVYAAFVAATAAVLAALIISVWCLIRRNALTWPEASRKAKKAL